MVTNNFKFINRHLNMDVIWLLGTIIHLAWRNSGNVLIGCQERCERLF